jgi:hypothetical protein
MNQDQAIALARKVAKKHSTAHAYLNNAASPDWLPHEWVVDAIMQAAGDPLGELHAALYRALNTDERGGVEWLHRLCDAIDPNPIPELFNARNKAS